MTTNKYGDLVLTREEYELLKSTLEKCGVNLNYSVTDCKTFECYVRNPYKTVVDGWGTDLQAKLSKEFFDRGY